MHRLADTLHEVLAEVQVLIVMVTMYLESKGPCVHEVTCTVSPAKV